METLKMTKKEQALLDSLDEFITKWKEWKETEKPPEIVLYRFQAAIFNSICSKIDEGLLPGAVDRNKMTYRGVPIRCQY